jgi:hypothetical protein
VALQQAQRRRHRQGEPRPRAGAETWGVLYEIHDRDGEALDRARRGCERIAVEVVRDGVRWRRADLRLGSHRGRLVARAVSRPAGRRARASALPPAWIADQALAPQQEAAAGEQMVFEDPSSHCFGAARTIALDSSSRS